MSSAFTNQCFHCTMQCMPVVPSKLRIGSFQRRISGSLWFLDSICLAVSTIWWPPYHTYANVRDYGTQAASKMQWTEITYPFRWAFFDWLCWDEFFDSFLNSQQHTQQIWSYWAHTRHCDRCTWSIVETWDEIIWRWQKAGHSLLALWALCSAKIPAILTLRPHITWSWFATFLLCVGYWNGSNSTIG